MTVNDLFRECCVNLYSFYKLFITRSFPDKVEAPHIKTLSNKLMQLTLGDFKRLCVAMPPRHSKSSMVTLAFPLWLIFNNPDLNILIVNNTATLSEKFGIELRELIKRYGALEPFHLRLSQVKSSKSHLMFEDTNTGELYRGSIRLTGADGSITGQDVDYLIIDDPYKGLAEEFTPSALQKKIDWFNVVIEQRIEPHTRLVLLHTRWHSNDLQGYLLENSEDYEFVTFPAILEDNTPLWKQRYSVDELLKKKERMGERSFQSIYQQQPMDLTSNFFSIENIIWTDKDINKGHPLLRCRAWDIASSDDGKGEKNDSTAGALVELTSNNYLILKDLVHGQFGNHTKNVVINQTHIDTPSTPQLIETGVAAAGQLLFQEWQQQMRGYRVIQAKPISSKVDRATPLQNLILDKRLIVLLEDNVRGRLLKEFTEFPYGLHDDIVDSVSYAVNYLTQQRNAGAKIIQGRRIG